MDRARVAPCTHVLNFNRVPGFRRCSKLSLQMFDFPHGMARLGRAAQRPAFRKDCRVAGESLNALI